MQASHEFALYYPELTVKTRALSVGQSFSINQPDLIMRITHVLRLQIGEELVLFDAQQSVHCNLQAATKKELKCFIFARSANMPLSPSITFILPLLKKDDFETALYSVVELGANKIQLVSTQKGQRAWGGQKELERCQRIMIAAAEQSKNFAMPDLIAPISLSSYVPGIPESTMKLYCDPQGISAMSALQKLVAEKPKELYLMVGPEGDLTDQEKDLLLQSHFLFMSLTPTVLRSVQAVAISLGLVRSVVR